VDNHSEGIGKINYVTPVITFACLIVMSVIANKKVVSLTGVLLTTLLFVTMFLIPIIMFKRRCDIESPDVKHFSSCEKIYVDVCEGKFGNLLKALSALAFLLFAFDMVPLIVGNSLVLTNEFVEFSEKTIINNVAYDNAEFYKNELAYIKFKSIDEYLNTDYSQLVNDTDIKKAKHQLSNINDPLKQKFIMYNKDEFTWQVMNRSFDLHNNQIMNPLNAQLLGAPLSSVHNLYGLGIPGLTSMFFKFVPFSYDNWLKFAFFLEWFYFISIPLSIYNFFKSKELASAVFVILLGTSFYGIYIGYFYLVNAQIPINPIRHGADFLAIISFGLYYKRKDILSLVCIFLTCSAAIMMGDHFGLALTAAFTMTLLVNYIEENKKPLDYAVLILLALSALATFKLSSLSNANNISVAYFINGFFSWSTIGIIKTLFIVYSCLYLFLFYLYVNRKTSKTWYLTLLLTLYSNMLCFHYIWHGVKVHLGISMTINCILVVCYTVLLFEMMKITKHIFSVLLVVALLIFSKNYYDFQKSKYNYNLNINRHVTYTWDYDVAKLKTTMPPEYFASAIFLINKYSPSDMGIYILSKYDYMLPVLTRKYSKMKYPNVPYFLVTSKEVDVITRQIEEEKPELLYIDTDIMLDAQLWTVNNLLTLSDNGLYRENQTRLYRLNELKKIFSKINHQYQLVEKGLIIDVYKRLD
jgi:hypothetical protein